MVDPDDNQFETYLKSFHPVVPEPLPAKRSVRRSRRLLVLAATAAAGLAAAVIVIVLLSRSSQPVPQLTGRSSPTQEMDVQSLNLASRSQISTTLLTKLALDDHQAFDEFMTEKLRAQFPPMKDERSALRVLAKESEERTR